jgi:hypothetical protein
LFVTGSLVVARLALVLPGLDLETAAEEPLVQIQRDLNQRPIRVGTLVR